LYYNINFM